jgi:hypothetical protein
VALQCVPLLRRRDSSRSGQVLVAVEPPELVQGGQDLTSVFFRCRGGGQARKPARKHLRPVNADLPRATFMSEEDDVVVALVDVA